jgi:putative flippase GtrA
MEVFCHDRNWGGVFLSKRVITKESKKLTTKMMRYGVVGLLGTSIHFGILFACVEFLHQNPIVSSTIAFAVVVIISYLLNYKWTFQSKQKHRYTLPRYVMVSVMGLWLNGTIMLVTVNIFGWFYLIGQLCAAFMVPISNFLINYYWAFRHREIPK